jgi:hypothetical protein
MHKVCELLLLYFSRLVQLRQNLQKLHKSCHQEGLLLFTEGGSYQAMQRLVWPKSTIPSG